MKKYLIESHPVFPSPDIEKTAKYYSDVLGFRAVNYLETNEPHICLYRDGTEIILTKANTQKVFTNRELYGYGYDAYFITEDQEELQNEFVSKGAKIVRPFQVTDYRNNEFVLEDIDGRWIAFGIKTDINYMQN
jgi:catechol 2,3-dioxygenase-like lactoylglutathione lyase family enzyme